MNILKAIVASVCFWSQRSFMNYRSSLRSLAVTQEVFNLEQCLTYISDYRNRKPFTYSK